MSLNQVRRLGWRMQATAKRIKDTGSRQIRSGELVTKRAGHVAIDEAKAIIGTVDFQGEHFGRAIIPAKGQTMEEARAEREAERAKTARLEADFLSKLAAWQPPPLPPSPTIQNLIDELQTLIDKCDCEDELNLYSARLDKLLDTEETLRFRARNVVPRSWIEDAVASFANLWTELTGREVDLSGWRPDYTPLPKELDLLRAKPSR